MKYFLTGVETNNKGAELMLYAILQEIERFDPNAVVYIDSENVKQGVDYVKTDLSFVLVDSLFRSVVNKFHINGFLKRLNLPLFDIYTKIPYVDYLIDGSGLHFTDQMTNSERVCYWKSILKRVKKFEAKIIFLPQGFGPITKTSTRDAISVLFDYSDLVFCRDCVSYQYLKNCKEADMRKIKLFPDFTSLVEGVFPSQYEFLRDAVCIIPNMQMVNKGRLSLSDYVNYLADIIQEVKRHDRSVYMLNHQGEEDDFLLEECKTRIGYIETVSGLNALETKGLISSAYLVISSRFHGAASALNSGVPCLATSWSHKYQCLFEDYQQTNNILSLNDIDVDLNMVDTFLNEENNREIRKQLNLIIPKQKKETQKMWNLVWSL